MLTLLRLVVDQPLAPVVRCSGCQKKFTRLPASRLCPGCGLVNVARAIVGLPPKVSDRPTQCCDAAEVCPCHGWTCAEHGHRQGRFGHD